MRNLEVIETELAAAREALSNIKGTPTEVYSRIVGYYRSVRNWNRGKREEYDQRIMFKPDTSLLVSWAPDHLLAEWSGPDQSPSEAALNKTVVLEAGRGQDMVYSDHTPFDEIDGFEEKIILFIRRTCPACPSAQAAAGRLGIPMQLYDADTEEGLAEAVRYQILSTPTAILVSSAGTELGRAHNAQSIKNLMEMREAVAV